MPRYTLGGFYLARYSDSPVGAFDEVTPNAWQHYEGLILLSKAVVNLLLL